MPSVREVLEALIDPKARMIREEAAGAEIASRILPADLAEQILANSEIERQRLLGKLAQTDENLRRLAEHLAIAKAAERELMGDAPGRAYRRERFDGTTVETQSRPASWKTPASIEASKTTAGIRAAIAHNKAFRGQTMTQLGEITRIRKIAATGKMTELLGLAARWSVPVLHVKLTKLNYGRQPEFSDVAGNPLPAAALKEDGTPALSARGNRG